MKPSDFPRDPKFRDPTTEPYLEQRDGQSVAHVFSYADVRRVQLNPDGEFSQNLHTFLPTGPKHIAWYFMWATDPGPDGRHDPLRGLVEDWFRRQAVAAMTPRIQGYARDLRKEIVAKGTGEFNLATEFAYRLSMRTICGLVGIPIEREQWMRDELIRSVAAADAATIEIRHEVESYLWELVAKRLVRPEKELLDVLIDGWAKGTITDRELLGFIWGFASAGTDTTGTGIVDSFALTGEFGKLDHLRSHVDDDQALATAVDEVLRYQPPFPVIIQIFTTRPATFGSIEVPAYGRVLAYLSAANRGPEVNGKNVDAASPWEFDIRRSPNRHLGFGVGLHHCLGAALARLEIVTAWRELLTYLPGLRLDESKPFERFAGIVDGVTQAHFVFDQREAERLLD